MQIPLFPLPLFLLPLGVARLRIVEPRFLNMVSIASRHAGFVIVLNDDGIGANWGSWVEIINFDQDKQNVLTLDVRCHSLVTITSQRVDNEGIQYGEVKKTPHWPELPHDTITTALSRSLLQLFEQKVELNQLYQQRFINSAGWVVARWLELLPLSLDVKKEFADKDSFFQAKQFLQQIVITDQKK